MMTSDEFRFSDDLFSDDDFDFSDSDDQFDDNEKSLPPSFARLATGQAGELTRKKLEELVQADEYNEAAWLWLAMLSEDPEEQRRIFHKVLELNPFNLRAHIALRSFPDE